MLCDSPVRLVRALSGFAAVGADADVVALVTSGVAAGGRDMGTNPLVAGAAAVTKEELLDKNDECASGADETLALRGGGR